MTDLALKLKLLTDDTGQDIAEYAVMLAVILVLVDRSYLDQQKQVNAYFQSSLDHWRNIYRQAGVSATIYQQRRTVALSLLQKLALPAGSRILEVGCAHGLTTVALAKEGFLVDGVDTVPEMVQATLQLAETSGLKRRIVAQVADIHDLPFCDDAFSLVLVVGVTEWLHSLKRPLQEVVRVLQAGGYLVITSDNKFSLANMIDPFRNPVIAPVKRIVRDLLLCLGIRNPRLRTRSYSIQEFDSYLLTAGLRKVDSITVGFGPFRFCRQALVPVRIGLKLHRKLQNLANGGFPFLRSSGYVYIVVAAKPMASRAARVSLPPVAA
jgi:SAM-dependent methyltransferase